MHYPLLLLLLCIIIITIKISIRFDCSLLPCHQGQCQTHQYLPLPQKTSVRYFLSSKLASESSFVFSESVSDYLPLFHRDQCQIHSLYSIKISVRFTPFNPSRSVSDSLPSSHQDQYQIHSPFPTKINVRFTLSLYPTKISIRFTLHFQPRSMSDLPYISNQDQCQIHFASPMTISVRITLYLPWRAISPIPFLRITQYLP